HFPDMGRGTGRHVKQNVHLLIGWVVCALGGNARPVVAILLHPLADVVQGAGQPVGGIQLSELELFGIHNLVGVRPVGSAVDIDGPDKEIGGSHKRQPDSVARGSDLRLDVGETAGTIKHANAVRHAVPAQRQSNFLRQQFEQVIPVGAGDLGNV